MVANQMSPALPPVGRLLTVVVVHNGTVHACDALTRVSGRENVTFAVDPLDFPAASEAFRLARRATLYYGDAGGAWRVRGTIEAGADPSRIRVHLDEMPSRGEQRDFIRAALRLPIWAEKWSGVAQAEAEELTRLVKARVVPLDADGWAVQDVDLSAGGARFTVSDTPAPNDVFDVRIALPSRPLAFATAARVLRVRASERPDQSVVAVQFVGLTEAEQDELFDFISDRLQDELKGPMPD